MLGSSQWHQSPASSSSESVVTLTVFFFFFNPALQRLVANHIFGLQLLCLRQNYIAKIEGLDELKDLEELELRDNALEVIEGLEHCNSIKCVPGG